MPLRAFVDGHEVIASALTNEQWEALREAVAEQKLSVVLPCCGTEGYLRRSAQGSAHFAHKRGAGEGHAPRCAMAGETLQHITAKALILEACGAAGYRALPEVAGDGWRADVLAEKPDGRPSGRIAFEVQWSFLKLRECLYRQRRYERAGVRGCWFFRSPPPQLFEGERLGARRDLPLFHLFVNADNTFSVGLNGTLHPLGAFVAALLRGRIRYCDEARAEGEQTLRLVFFPFDCPNCGARSHIYTAARRLTSRCGVVFTPDEPWYSDSFAFHPQVRQAAERALATPEGRRYKLGAIKPRTDVDGSIYTSFGCPRCDGMFDRPSVEMALYGARRLGEVEAVESFETPLRLRAPLTAAYGHWCYPSAGGFCCG
jgi:predicted RNA-binding Zn-ribbon protein involved in translation (DUF1610 family)